MFKILYAAGNRNGAKLQLKRVLQKLDPSKYNIKVAGYYRMGMFLDWTLDALFDPFDATRLSVDNDNFEILCSQIQFFNPDLIISDLECFASYAGQLLGKPVWQVSPTLLQYVELPNQVGAQKYKILCNPAAPNLGLIQNILYNADRKYIYSHFGTASNPVVLPSDYRWMQPYHYVGSTSLPCAHDIVSILPSSITIDKLKEYQDVVVFDDNIVNKNKHIDNIDEYACNIKNCSICIGNGLTDILADAFYNQKFITIFPDLFDAECVLNMLLTQYHKIGAVSFDHQLNVPQLNVANTAINSEIPFLHQEIDNFFGQ